MEAGSGTVLYEKNADEALPPASVTKIMTVLLVLEALDSGSIHIDDRITVSDYAASMGGSQVYLRAGEEMTVNDLLKCVIVASANDAAVALAEAVCGSEEAFVARMNARASELGMQNTTFRNTNGLDDEVSDHLTTARDIAIMTRETLKHSRVFEYTTIWMDTIRDGAFGLTNTNRLVRFYRGCNGLKTGSTSKAGYCISATAERDGMQLICVIMGAPNKDARNSLAASLLDFGFAGWSVVHFDAAVLDPIAVSGAAVNTTVLKKPAFSALVRRDDIKQIKETLSLPKALSAPLTLDQAIGEAVYSVGDQEIGRTQITVGESIPRISFAVLFSRMFARFCMDPLPND
ncbi:MAG: D-alanyl-D-alanine carboxypeptidase [Clostridia bacterium]|nr:D-alanyl-D-alanine carboxypeptidase [Clostridia bacterium]